MIKAYYKTSLKKDKIQFKIVLQSQNTEENFQGWILIIKVMYFNPQVQEVN
jgi:hypothetical protein